MKYIILLLIVMSLAYLATSARPRDLLVLRVLNVGQGDSIYLRLPTGEDILVDAGPDDRVVSELGRFMPLGDRTIELLIISHNHADHIGGLKSILEEYEIDRLWISGAIHTSNQYIELLKTLKIKNIPATIVRAGNKTETGEVGLLALHPPVDMLNQNPEDQHDATIVIKVSYKTFCALLTGDLHEGHEATILEVANKLRESLSCPVLKITHHGSKYGSSESFLAAVKPEVSLISVGAKNQYGHPAPELLDRLKKSGARIFRTDLHGTINVSSNGTTFSTTTEK